MSYDLGQQLIGEEDPPERPLVRVLKAVGGIVVGAAIVALLAYGLWYAATAPREGVVRATWVVPAHWYDYTTSTCWSYDKNMNCTFRTYQTHHDWVPDACYVRVDDVEKTHRQADWGVDCATLATYHVGEWEKVP